MTADLRKLAHFVAVAEEPTITAAAGRLHLTQQALSTSLRALEREIGVPLLERTSRGVALLPASRALYADAVPLLAAARAAVERARRVGRGEPETLRIGHTPAVTGDEVTELLAAPAVAGLGVSLHVAQMFPAELVARLLDGRLELGLSRAMEPPSGLVGRTVAEHRLRVAVAAGHRLAGRGRVALADLAGECLVVWAPPGRSGYTDWLLDRCRLAGFTPRHRVNPVQGTPPVTAVLGSHDVALVTAPAGPAVNGAVRVLDLDPHIAVPVRAMWPAVGHHPTRARLLDLLARSDQRVV